MAPDYSLENVIRKVSSAAKAEDNECVVIVDAKKKGAVPRRGLWGDYAHYLVRNSDDPRNEARVKIEHVVLRDLQHEVSAVVTMHLSCPGGKEERLAEALFDLTRSPEEMLARHVERWLSEICREKGVEGFVRARFAEPERLQARVADAVLRETGMQAQVLLALHEEPSLGSIAVHRPELRVRVKDYDEEQELELRVTLEVDDENRAAAVLHSRRNLELPERVLGEVGRYLRRNVTLQEFCDQLSSGAAREGLAAYLNGVLAPTGRRVGSLVVQARAPQGVEASLPLNVPVRCKVHEFPDEIVINNNVLLLLQDLARYRMAGSPPLEAWLQKKLNATIPQLLFDTRYIDLLINFSPVEGSIKEALRNEAAAIGYEIKQFVTVPDLPPIRLRDNFSIDTEGAFETALRGVDVKLQVVVTARIPDLKQIESLLNRRQDVPRLMEEAVHGVLRENLHGMDPERIYMRFHHPDPAGHPDERPVRDELSELLRARLEREFHAEVISITIKMAETRLIERFNKLQERICPFAVHVASFHGGPAVVINGNFRVIGVDPKGWHNFQLLDCELEEIRSQVEIHLLARLQTMRSEQLTYRQDEHRAQLEALVTMAATRYVADAFGLSIEVTSVRRELTGIETATSADEEAAYIARLQLSGAFREDRVEAEQEHNRSRVEQIKKLLGERTKLVHVEGEEGEVALLDAKIEALKSSLGEVRIPTLDTLRLEVLGALPPLALANPGGDAGEVGGVSEVEGAVGAEP